MVSRSPDPPSTPLAFGTCLAAMSSGLSTYARRVLTTADPLEKVRLTAEAAEAWARTRETGGLQEPPPRPSRPSLPRIVHAGDMPTVKQVDVASNIYHLHGLAHVELNAIDLSFDTMIRFARPADLDVSERGWYDDWMAVAADEARHFAMLDGRLKTLGSSYGALPAHGLVWSSADVSRGCRKERLALGQLVAEARGLDAGPRLAERLVGAGDNESAEMVRTIAEEELMHVRVGVKWFIRECERDGVDAMKEFQSIAMRLSNPGAFSPPFDEKRRAEAGLDPEWYLPVAEQMREQVLARRREKKLEREVQFKSRGAGVGAL